MEVLGPVLIIGCRFGRIPHVLNIFNDVTGRITTLVVARVEDGNWSRNIPRRRLDDYCASEGKALVQ